MLKSKKKIVFTGGNGRFGKVLQKKINNTAMPVHFPSSKELNILNVSSIKKYLKLKKPKYLIHAAGLSRPMHLHDKNISKSIDLNIIGTANITKVCSDLNIKLIYFSTSYVYAGEKNNYKENDSLKPINNYGLSKLGGEAAVQMYKNSLILRISMTEKPFIHKSAFNDFITNFIFHDEVAEILRKLLTQKGIINLGGSTKTVYDFAKKYNPNIKKSSAKNKFGNSFPLNSYMSLKKLNKIIKS